MEKYIKLQTLGQGTFGEVYLVRCIENNRLYALKKVMLDESRKQRTKEYVLSEAKILSQLKHPNIVAYHDSFFDDREQYLVIVQDYCDGGTLEDRIHAAAETSDLFDELQIMQWFVQILMAVQYMHSQKILHRDMKSQNVFMKKKGNMCKLGDFGISKRMSNTLERASTLVGTPYYLAPEMCQDIPYSSKADVWALGCVLYEMCALKPPFDANNYVSLAFKIVKCSPDPVSDGFTAPLRELIDTILNKNPDERPSATQLLKLPYIQSMLNYFVMYKSSLPNLNDKQRRDSDPLLSTLTEANQFTRLCGNIPDSPRTAHATKLRTAKSAACVNHSSRCSTADDVIDCDGGQQLVKSSQSTSAVTSDSQYQSPKGKEDMNSGRAGGSHMVKSSRSAGIVNSSNSQYPSTRAGDALNSVGADGGKAAGGYVVKSSQSAGAVNTANTRCQTSKLCSSAEGHYLTVISSPVVPKRLSPIAVNGKNRSPGSAGTPSPQRADAKLGEDVIDYEDDFEAEEAEELSAAESDIDQQDEDAVSDTDSSIDVPAAAAAADLFNDEEDVEPDNEYYDDFEEYSPEQEMEEVLSYAKEMQQLSWNSLEDVTITDDGPVDIRKLLQPHCEAVVGKERFDAIITKNNPTSAKNRQTHYVRSSTDQICHFIEELYGNGDDQP